jgi:hypothetical protein
MKGSVPTEGINEVNRLLVFNLARNFGDYLLDLDDDLENLYVRMAVWHKQLGRA